MPVTSEAKESPVEKELRRRAEAAERLVEARDIEIKQRVRGMQLRDDRIDNLERLLWSRGIDPATPPPLLPEVTAHDS